MNKERICGIYCIENIINNKKYVGQSININLRWKRHISALNNNNHYNSHLQQSWNKHGSESFEFNIVEICDKSLLNEREIYWIKKFNSFENGYNETLGGDNFPKDTSKEVYMYGLDGEFVRKFDSLSDALMHVNGNSITNIVKCCNGDLETAYKYIWKFEYYDNVTPKTIASNNVNREKEIHQYNLDGTYIKSYKNAMEAKLLNNIPTKSTNITSCCNGKRKTAYGYIWSYNKQLKIDISNNEKNIKGKKVYQYDLNGKYICEHENSEKACKSINGSFSSNIRNCCLHKSSCAYGYIWSYEKKQKLDKVYKKISRKNMPVYQYDLNGNLLKKFDSLKYVMNIYNNHSISECCRGRRNSAAGFIWAYEKYDNLEDLKDRYKIYQEN